MSSSQNPSPTATAMQERALALLSSLDESQHSTIAFQFADEERHRWFYTPTDHGGLPLASMSSDQHRLVYRLLATGLSEQAFNTASTIMGLENVLDRDEDWATSFGRARGRDPLMYFVAIFGDPEQATWSWRVGGHHVSVHFLVVDGQVRSVAPLFLGANPASVPLLGPHPLRPLGGVEDLGREVFRSLNEAQRDTALISTVAPPDLLTGNRSQLSDGDEVPMLADIMRGPFDDDTLRFLDEFQQRLEQQAGWTDEHQASITFSRSPHGLEVGSLEPNQQEVVRRLVDLYVNRLPDELADQQRQLVSGRGFDRLHFVWAGSADEGEPHYYRLQNDRVVIEYDKAQDNANHVHTVWRDLESDFGGDALAAHYHDHH